MKPIIFLDIDGVINLRGWHGPSIDNLNTLIREFDAKIVVTSDRRYYKTLQGVWEMLGKVGVIGALDAGVTTILKGSLDFEMTAWSEPRRTEIELWINTYEVGPYVVLDDMSPLKDTEFGPRMVLTYFEKGFDETALWEARVILQNQGKSA